MEDKFLQIRLKDMLQEIGIEKTQKYLSSFICYKNKDIEDFIRNKAIEFDRRGFARTYLIFMKESDEMKLVAYYSLTNKSIFIQSSSLSSTMRKRINIYGNYDPLLKRHILPAILIAQFGKNYSYGYDKEISGDHLMDMAIDKIKEIQNEIGGRFTYVECEEVSSLLKFYESHGFVIFGSREAKNKDESSDKKLCQLLKYVKESH